jgi:DNA-binding MarR family transcriptional regulator
MPARSANEHEDDALPRADLETSVSESDHHSLRLWLRLLTCTSLIEARLRTRLREEFATTLPRFDLLAQLERAPEGLTMGELSRRMMVSGGNATGIVTQLVSEGLVDRAALPHNRRTFIVRLTEQGRAFFTRMAREHETWVIDLLGHLEAREVDDLMVLLARVKQGAGRRLASDPLSG